VPASVSPGSYTLGLIVDADKTVTESDESNNTLGVAVVVN
jgi:subtilase family serine protease